VANSECGISTRYSLLASSAAIAILGVLADVLDGHHVLVLGAVEHDDALGRATRDPDTLAKGDRLGIRPACRNWLNFEASCLSVAGAKRPRSGKPGS
jgi:hypothetical protein